MHEDVKKNGKLWHSKGQRADWKWKASKIQRRKRHTWILKNFFCCGCNYIMHVSVYETCRIQSISIPYKNHQDILNVTKVMTSYIQEPGLKILVKFQSSHKSSWVPHPILAAYWSDKQVVPLLGCCSDAPGSPANRLVICGDRTFFQLNFQVESMLETYLEKMLHFCNTS